MNILIEKLNKAKTVGIIGHMHPDGDCIGSSLGLWNYINDNLPEIDAKVYLDIPPAKYSFMKGFDKIETSLPKEKELDLVISLDCSSQDRLGTFVPLLISAKDTLCIDHHVTNTNYIKDMVLKADASSTCEVLYQLLDEDKITKEIAQCIYTGIVTDTGVFKYASTSAKTMNIAGRLMSKGIDFSEIIDGTFFRKNYHQTQILGRALLESIEVAGGKVICSIITKKMMDFYGVSGKDLDGIIDQLRVTEGNECAIFLYQTGTAEYKVSMRSNHVVDVSKIAAKYGGGGHIRAAGCTMNGMPLDIVNILVKDITEQL